MSNPLTTVTTERRLGVVPEPDGFDRFYRAHADTLRQGLCLALGDVELGTEAADEAMARACERWGDVSGYANPTGWAYRVGLNWARSRQRRRRWRDRRPVPDLPVPTVPDPDLTVALGRLGVDQRAVVVCRYLLDWSVDDTAAALDIPVGTVKSRLARALDHLARHLEVPR
jgi:DNA-directed RNA polymerase specialized sigma24 family protein